MNHKGTKITKNAQRFMYCLSRRGVEDAEVVLCFSTEIAETQRSLRFGDTAYCVVHTAYCVRGWEV